LEKQQLTLSFSRWIRLLFGREFEFKEVLRIWDLLFAENLRADIVDLTCVAMLLRCRWALVEADYTTAITALTHYSMPQTSEGPQQLVRDATFLDKNRDELAGATLIQHYTGRRPKMNETSGSRSQSGIRATRTIQQHRQSPSASPGRFASPQRQLEGLFQDVAGGLQKRTEGWNVSKAVRSAVGEVRRNMNNYQTSHSRQPSADVLYGERRSLDGRAEEIRQAAQRKIEELETRNKHLAKMLDDALQALRSTKLASSESPEDADQSFNMSLARIQFVSVYLTNSDIPIPPEVPILKEEKSLSKISQENSRTQTDTAKSESSTPSTEPSSQGKGAATIEEPKKETPKTVPSPQLVSDDENGRSPAGHKARPSLMDSSFSFMLGENRHRSSFVTSAAALPEQRRESESKTRSAQLSNEAKAQQGRSGSESEDDGFTLTKMRGGRQ
jgi:TBC1 domain family protein 5